MVRQFVSAKFLTIQEIIEKIDSIDNMIIKKKGERNKYSYHSKEYQSLSTTIYKLKTNVARWRRIIDMRENELINYQKVNQTVPKKYMTPGFIKSRIEYFNNQIKQKIDERKDYTYNSYEYTKISSRIYSIRKNIEKLGEILNENEC